MPLIERRGLRLENFAQWWVSVKIQALANLRVACTLRNSLAIDPQSRWHAYLSFQFPTGGGWIIYGLESIVSQFCRPTPHHAILWMWGRRLNEKNSGRSPFPWCCEQSWGGGPPSALIANLLWSWNEVYRSRAPKPLNHISLVEIDGS